MFLSYFKIYNHAVNINMLCFYLLQKEKYGNYKDVVMDPSPYNILIPPTINTQQQLFCLYGETNHFKSMNDALDCYMPNSEVQVQITIFDIEKILDMVEYVLNCCRFSVSIPDDVSVSDTTLIMQLKVKITKCCIYVEKRFYEWGQGDMENSKFIQMQRKHHRLTTYLDDLLYAISNPNEVRYHSNEVSGN